MADDKKNNNSVKTMQGDLAVARAASKGLVVNEDGSLDFLRTVQQKLSDINNASKPAAVQQTKEKIVQVQPQPAAASQVQPIPVPKAITQDAPPPPPVFEQLTPGEAILPQEDKPGLEALPAKTTTEGILSEAGMVAEEKLKQDAQLQLAETQRLEEQKRAEGLLRAQKEQREREEARRKKEDQQRQIILQEERKRVLAQQRAEQERRTKEEQQRKLFEEAERQRIEREKAKELEKQKEIERQRAQEEANRLKEEQMRSEMERLALQQRTLPVILRELKKRVRVHKVELEKELTSLAGKEAPLNEKKSQLGEKVAVITDGEFKQALASEQEIEAKEEEFLKSGKRKQTTLEQEKILSQRLWEIEDRRKIAEKARWEVEDRIKKLKNEIQEVDTEIVSLTASRTRIREQIKNLVAQEKLVDFAEWKKGVEEEILDVQEERDGLAPALERANSEKSAAQAAFNQISEREISINENLKAAEGKEKESQDPELKRLAEKSRWEIGNELRKTTQEKWECEKQLSDAVGYEKEQQSKIDKINARLNSLEDKISAQELTLVKAGISPKRLRDQIAAFLIENELEVDPTLLNDITQLDETEVAPENLSADTTLPQDSASQETAVVEPAPADENTAKIPEQPQEENKKENKAAEIQPPAEIQPEVIKEAPPEIQQESPSVKKKETLLDQPKEAEIKPETGSVPVQEEAEIKPETKSIPAQEPVDKRPKTAFAAAPPVSSQMFREPIDESPAAPMNVPIFPDQGTGQEVPENGGGADLNESPGEVASQIAPEVKNNIIQDPQEQIQPEIESSLENRWTEIANANDAVVTQAGESKAAFVEAQQLKVPRRAKNSQKVIVQILVVLIIITVIGGAGTLILLSKMNQPAPKVQTNVPKKTTPAKTSQQTQQNSTNNNNGTQNTTPQTQTTPGGAPQSLISTVSPVSIITDNLTSVPSLLAPYLTTSRDIDGYYRVLIQDKTNNTYVGLRQLFDIFKIKAPANLLNNLNDNATLFLYSNRGQNRFGFIASTNNAAGVAQIMKGWENTMEQDTDGFFKFLGKQQPSKKPGDFLNGTSSDQQIAYRYIFFQPDSANLGISYATYRNYFIFTSSVDSLTQIVSQLPQ